MKELKNIVVLIISSLLLVSCASGTIGQEDYDENSTARGPAYVSDAIHVRKPMKSHADWRPIPFYYKHCTDIGKKFYYSKTAYDCTKP